MPAALLLLYMLPDRVVSSGEIAVMLDKNEDVC